MRKSTLSGALSFVIAVWRGTSMNCSRMSTLVPESMTGTRNRKPGLRTRPGFVWPQRLTTIRSHWFTIRTDVPKTKSTKATIPIAMIKIAVCESLIR